MKCSVGTVAGFPLTSSTIKASGREKWLRKIWELEFPSRLAEVPPLTGQFDLIIMIVIRHKSLY